MGHALKAEAESQEFLKIIRTCFDGAPWQRQQKLISDLRAKGGLLSDMADVLDRRARKQWVWIATDIPGLSIPSAEYGK
jgi:hypothetical protein